MECAMMATLSLPVATRIESTLDAISAAVVALDCETLYENAESSAAVYPESRKRCCIVVHVLALAFQPCTKSTGVCATVRGAYVGVDGLRAPDSPSPGPVR